MPFFFYCLKKRKNGGHHQLLKKYLICYFFAIISSLYHVIAITHHQNNTDIDELSHIPLLKGNITSPLLLHIPIAPTPPSAVANYENFKPYYIYTTAAHHIRSIWCPNLALSIVPWQGSTKGLCNWTLPASDYHISRGERGGESL